MPTVIEPGKQIVVAAGPVRKRWTREECASLESAGILTGADVELIEGELIDRMGKNRPHTNTLIAVYEWLIEAFGMRFVNPETSIDVAPNDLRTNEPEPDLIVLRRDSREYVSNPRPEDLRLVVEIADTTLAFDLGVKAALYARAGIGEYWVVDIAGQRIIVHREPGGGSYGRVVAYGRGEEIAPLAVADKPFLVDRAFL